LWPVFVLHAVLTFLLTHALLREPGAQLSEERSGVPGSGATGRLPGR
jgi:hypothetical protein